MPLSQATWDHYSNLIQLGAFGDEGESYMDHKA